MSSGYYNRNPSTPTVVVVRHRMAPGWKIVIACVLLCLLLFVLKVAQVGLAAEWPWIAVFAPVWVPAVLAGLLRLLVFLEANKPGGRR